MYNTIKSKNNHIKMWTSYVPVESEAIDQLRNVADLDIVSGHVSVMPDVHVGKGATIGSVIPTINALIPSAVGVDIGCGILVNKTSLKASDLPDNLYDIRTAIEIAVPVGFGCHENISETNTNVWKSSLDKGFKYLGDNYKEIYNSNNINHLGTLGGGNHFIEICLDENDNVWVMMHSGSRGVGNVIGNLFINLAKKDMENHIMNLPNKDLAYLKEGSKYFDDYVFALDWAQNFARLNRESMMREVLNVLHNKIPKPFTYNEIVVNCHHNYVSKENHFGKDMFITRKGAVSAKVGEMGVIPGSMGAKSFIVRGLGNEDSYCSCSHGAGRVMSRSKAKKLISLDEHIASTNGVECRKDIGVIDESPKAYKNIDDVMKSQDDLVEILYTLKQILCVKG